MTRYSEHVSNTITPQREKARAEQVENHAGGYVFQLDCWKRLDRFLILGTEGGTFYAGERAHTKQAAASVAECIQADGPRTVARIVEISEQGRAPKNDPAIFALAMAAGAEDAATRRAALAAIPKVCRIGTHLFHFAADVEHFRRWGRSLKRAMGAWYTDKDPNKLAYQLVKYQQRDGWSHKDVLRLAHPTPKTEAHQALFRYVQLGLDGMGKVREGNKRDKNALDATKLPAIVNAVEQLHAPSVDVTHACALIKDARLPHECVPNELKNSTKIWDAMLPSMGVTALIRNLGKLSSLDMTQPMSETTKFIVAQLTNEEILKQGRVHPLTILYAMKTYAQGRGLKGSLTWTPERAIVDALDDAFYMSFQAVEPTGLNYYLALDCSGSMIAPLSNTSVTCREGSAAMAMLAARTEKNWTVSGFTSSGFAQGLYGGQWGGNTQGLTSLAISPRQRLDDICKTIQAMPFGGTDCALPMMHATAAKIPVDVFVVYTDNETWAGGVHPFQALREYRQKMGRNAKLVVVGMTATEFSIADPKDAGMLDVVGFDTATPSAMAEFAKQ